MHRNIVTAADQVLQRIMRCRTAHGSGVLTSNEVNCKQLTPLAPSLLLTKAILANRGGTCMNQKLITSLVYVCCFERQSWQTQGKLLEATVDHTDPGSICWHASLRACMHACMGEHVLLEGACTGKAQAVVLQDAQSAEVQAYFSQWGPVHSCQLAHNDLALIALISRQGPLQVAAMHSQICFPEFNGLV